MDKLQLNDEQLEAIKHGKGPLLIIAGAGTGKTTVVAERIKYLITSEIALPSEILALTFTEKAVQEMVERVDVAMPYGYTQMWISTFHSFCDRVLRSEALAIGLDPAFRLLTEAESIRFFRQNLFEFDLKYFRPLGNPTKFVAGILQHFSRLKDEDVLPKEYLKWAKTQSKEERIEIEKWTELAKAYQKYEELKERHGVMDFSDLISNTLKLFRERPNVLQEYWRMFKYILVDEFQDTNFAQNELAKLIVGKTGNITVVGDDDQAVYRWRGAATSNIIQFREAYPQAKIVALTQNYRSTQAILDYSYKLIQNNNPDRLEVKEKIDKRLISSRGKKGDDPEFLYADRVEGEAELVVKKIIQLVGDEGRKYSDFAILVRANNYAEPFSRALARAAIPYQFLGPGQLFKQEEVRELIAYLKVLYNFEDSPALYKVLTMEHFGLDARDLAALTNYTQKFRTTLFEAAERADDIFLSETGREKIKKIVGMVYKHLQDLPKQTAGQIVYNFLEDSGILKKMIDASGFDERKAQNIAKFFDKLKSYETEHEDASVFAVVDWIDLSLDIGESPQASDFDWMKENAVNILTIHSSKGLEFPVVFVVNLVAQRFPTMERREQIPIPEDLIKEILPVGDHHLQEERRLFYVAMTRAQDHLYISAANYYGEGKREKRLSPFVFETFGEKVMKNLISTTEQLSIFDYAPSVAKALEPKPASQRTPITFLSYSQIETFQFCPLHYKLRYIYKIPTPATAPLSFGNTLHNTLHEFYNRLSKGEKITKDGLLEIYDKNWVREGYQAKSHEEQMKERGILYLDNYLASGLHNPNNLPQLLEVPFIFPLDRINSLKIGGKIDRVDRTEDGIEIIDYKTTDFVSKDAPTDKELKSNLQLSIYAMASLRQIHPLFGRQPEEVTLSMYYFDLGKKVSTKRTREDLEKAVAEILQTKDAIETSDFACSGGFFCKNCEYKLYCGGD